MGSSVGVVVTVFDGVGCDVDMVGDEDGKKDGEYVGLSLGSVLAEPLGNELILYCLK